MHNFVVVWVCKFNLQKYQVCCSDILFLVVDTKTRVKFYFLHGKCKLIWNVFIFLKCFPVQLMEQFQQLILAHPVYKM